MASIFTRIIQGEIPCYKVAENEGNIAFLDINPLVKGHTLVVPKCEVDNLFNLSEEQYLDLMKFVKQVAEHLQETMECERVGVTVLGFDVPHAHIHLVPMSSESDMLFTNEKLKLSPGEFGEVLDRIKF